MRLSTVLCLMVVVFSTLIVASGKISSGRTSRVNPVHSPSLPVADQVLYNLTDFGAVGDGITDNGPALQSALNAIAEAGGGTLFVPAGRYAINTPVYKDFTGLASDVSILGVESSTPVPPPTSSGQVLIRGLDLT
jgi:hypothetical protein